MKNNIYRYALASAAVTAGMLGAFIGLASAQSTTTWDGNYNNNYNYNGGGGEYNQYHHQQYNQGYGQGHGGEHGYGGSQWYQSNYTNGSGYQLFVGRAFFVHGNTFVLYTAGGRHYTVYFYSGFQTWNNHGRGMRWMDVHSGDLVRVDGVLRNGVIYATLVRDLSR